MVELVGMIAHREREKINRLLPHAGVSIRRGLPLKHFSARTGTRLCDRRERSWRPLDPIGLVRALEPAQGSDVRALRGHNPFRLSEDNDNDNDNASTKNICEGVS